jgi:predicted metal-dependent TIM-barrel fold hydrolase
MVNHHNRPPDASPTVDDLLRDPIVHLLMRRDGTDEETIRRIAREAALRLYGPAACDTLAA